MLCGGIWQLTEVCAGVENYYTTSLNSSRREIIKIINAPGTEPRAAEYEAVTLPLRHCGDQNIVIYFIWFRSYKIDVLVQDPRAARPYLFSDEQNMYNRVVLV